MHTCNRNHLDTKKIQWGLLSVRHKLCLYLHVFSAYISFILARLYAELYAEHCITYSADIFIFYAINYINAMIANLNVQLTLVDIFTLSPIFYDSKANIYLSKWWNKDLSCWNDEKMDWKFNWLMWIT